MRALIILPVLLDFCSSFLKDVFSFWLQHWRIISLKDQGCSQVLERRREFAISLAFCGQWELLFHCSFQDHSEASYGKWGCDGSWFSFPGMPYSLPFILLPIVGSSAVSLPSFSLAGSPCFLDTYCTSLLTWIVFQQEVFEQSSPDSV